MGFNEINGDFILADSIVPIGTSIESGCSSPPTNYLEEDGSALSRTTYATLFSAIGTTYGAGDGSTTFNIPDRRGNVGRGAGTSSGYAYNVTITQGTKTDDAFETHTHGYIAPFLYSEAEGGSGNAARISQSYNTGSPTGRTASETRVKSLGMKYYIKYQ